MRRRALAGRRVVLTGASAGVGRAVAQALGEQKARVALIARSEEGLEAAAREIREAGGEAMVLPLDVADAAAVEAASDAVVKAWGGIDAWINDAMVSVFAPVQQTTPEEYRRVTEVTYLGYVYGTLAALKHMAPVDRGHIIQVGSALAYRSIPLQSAYCGAKAAIRGFTDSLRCELAHGRSNIRVSMVQLPAVNTPQFQQVRSRLPLHPQPVPPIFQPEVMARAILHLLEHPTRELWVGWPVVKAIVGQKFVPGFIDRYLGRRGYDAQQTARLRHHHWDDLDAPPPGDLGAHGEFDDVALTYSTEFWIRKNRRALALGAVGLVAAITTAVAGRRPPGWRRKQHAPRELKAAFSLRS